MTSKFLRRGLLLGLAVMLSACATDSLEPTRIVDPEEALALQREIKGSRNFDLSRVSVARLKLDGEPLEVTSLLPATISRSRTGGSPAATVFAFSRPRDSFILFTRDGDSGGAYRLEVPLAQWKPGSAINFPVVNPDGTVTNRRVELVHILVR
jgi:hypothetical protein